MITDDKSWTKAVVKTGYKILNFIFSIVQLSSSVNMGAELDQTQDCCVQSNDSATALTESCVCSCTLKNRLVNSSFVSQMFDLFLFFSHQGYITLTYTRL
jgi:hypothetical protein